MKTELTKTQLTAGGLTLAVVMSLMGLGYYYNKSNNYNQMVGQEKLKNESLITEKIHLEKEVLDLTNSLNEWKTKNATLDNSLVEYRKTISQKEGQIKSLKGGQANAAKLRKEIAGLQKLKAELTNKLAELSKSNDDLRNKNNNLQNAIAGLEKDKANLENKLAGMQCVATNSFLVETSKKKQEKLTVKAKRTKNVKVGFDVNQVGADDVTFKITSPDGKLLDSKTIKVASVQTDEQYVSTTTDPANVQKRIEYTYKPKSKLGKGTYKIEVYKKDTYLGENQFKLN